MLREVREDDLDVLFEQQREPEAVAMAVFPAREREAFDAHWRRVLANDRNVVRAIEVDGEVAGNIGSWEQDGKQLVGYWLGREVLGPRARHGGARRVRRRSSGCGRCTPGSPPATSARSACSRSAASSEVGSAHH